MKIKPNKTKIAFFGTSDKSVPILDALLKRFNLVLCVTKSDTKIGRKQELKETKVKEWSEQNNVPFILIDNFKRNDLADINNTLIELEADIIVVADFNYIIPSTILSTPNLGVINIHFSLLPKYRGASPVQHTILHGDNFAGVTFQLMDEKMDTGDSLYKFSYKLDGNETSKSLYDELFLESAKALPKILNDYIAGNIEPKKQNHTEATYCYSKSHPKSTYIYKEDALIDWEEDSLDYVYNKIRAFDPWPIAWTTLQDLNNANLYINEDGILSSKHILIKDLNKSKIQTLKIKKPSSLRVKIYKANFIKELLEIEQIQVEGKNKTNWKDFLNGYCEKI